MSKISEKIKKSWSNVPKKEKIFQIISVILVVGILSTYLGRLIYFKIYYDNRKKDILGELTLAESLVEKTALTTVNNGLVKNDDGSYVYKGFVDDNYLVYDNRLYRMISIDQGGAIKIVSEDSIMNFFLENADSFQNTTLHKFLNDNNGEKSGIFVDEILIDGNYIVASTICTDKADKLNNIGCSVIYEKSFVGLLSLFDYEQAGGASSYLNNQTNFWLSNCNDNGAFWFVNETGNLSISASILVAQGVRPVLTLSYNVKSLSGDGTKNNPYVITKTTVKTIKETITGQYISYSGSLWKVSLSNEVGTIAMLEGSLEKTNSFGKTNEYSIDSGAGKYLNRTYLNTLINFEKYLVEYEWPIGKFTSMNVLDYADNYNATLKCYVGMPNTSYPGFDDVANVYLTSQLYESVKLAYCTTENKALYSVLLEEKLNLRPVICFNNEIKIVSGTGTMEDPFILEVIE